MRMLNSVKLALSLSFYLTSQDLCLTYKSWVHTTLEYGNSLYSGAALSNLQHPDRLQTYIEHTCCSTEQPLLQHCNDVIINLVCHLLTRERQRNLQQICPPFYGTDDICRWSSCQTLDGF